VYDCPALQKNIGDACDDGNPNTVNDRVRAGCICQGDAIVITNPIVLTCPKDITVYTSSPAFNSSNVLWNNPVATTSCAVGTVVQNCVTGDISGFKSLGKFGNSQYYVSTDKKNWESANTYCKSKGGYLTAVTSKEENDFIYGKLLNHNEAYFIGFSNKPDGAFQWVTGETAAYLAWEIGFPTYKTNTEYYVCMLGWSGGKWMNVNPSVEFQYIMEVDCGSGTSTVGAVNIAQVAGPANNSVVNIGTYKITYSAVDNCANKNTCGFNLTVATPPFGGDGSNVTALEAHHSNGKTDLQWITNIGITDGTAFLQRSYNGTNFETVKTALYSNPARALNAYAFEDFTQTDGTVYYRIVLQMGDGSIRISDTQNVRPVSYKGVFVYPNPTSGEVNVQLKSFEKQAVELVISNLLGQEVYREKIAAVQTSVKTISPVDVDLKQGFYILSIIYKNQSYRYPFTVAK
jgi:hypothetical protein